MKCAHCEYEWQSKSELEWVTCPNCTLKTKRGVNHAGNTPPKV